jgi:hypothetical protein
VNTTIATTMPAVHPIMNPRLVPFARGDSQHQDHGDDRNGAASNPNGQGKNLTNPRAHALVAGHQIPLVRTDRREIRILRTQRHG